MSDDYTNLDLITAEELLRAAGNPGMADALNHHANGVRNMIQGIWGTSFIKSLEGLLVKHIDPLTVGQGTLLAAQEETARGLKKLSSEFATVISRIERLEAQQAQIIDNQQTKCEQINQLGIDVKHLQHIFDVRTERFARFEQTLEAIKRQTLVDTLTFEERIKLVAANRRVAELLTDLEAIVEEHRSRTRHDE